MFIRLMIMCPIALAGGLHSRVAVLHVVVVVVEPPPLGWIMCSSLWCLVGAAPTMMSCFTFSIHGCCLALMFIVFAFLYWCLAL